MAEKKKKSWVVHASHPSTGEAKAGGCDFKAGLFSGKFQASLSSMETASNISINEKKKKRERVGKDQWAPGEP